MIDPPERPRLFGKYAGIVDQVDQATGRLKVKVPTKWGDQALPAWALPCWPPAVATHPEQLHAVTVNNGPDDSVGVTVQKHPKLVHQWTLPQPGAGVWVEFAEGDPDQPIWVGFYEVITDAG